MLSINKYFLILKNYILFSKNRFLFKALFYKLLMFPVLGFFYLAELAYPADFEIYIPIYIYLLLGIIIFLEFFFLKYMLKQLGLLKG